MIEEIYDKVSWHFPDGENCPSLEAATVHLCMVMEWLNYQHLLSEEGLEAIEVGVDADFSLTSYMLTDRGNRLLAAYYADWVSTVRYGVQPSMGVLENGLSRLPLAGQE